MIPVWKRNKTTWGRRYRRYLEELKKLNKASGANESPLSRKNFRSLWEASGNLKSKKAKSVEIAKAQIYGGASAETARKVSMRLKEAGIEDYDYWDIARGEIGTGDVAELLNLNEEYHKRRDENLAKGMSYSEASKEAKEWISWYYYGSK